MYKQTTFFINVSGFLSDQVRQTIDFTNTTECNSVFPFAIN